MMHMLALMEWVKVRYLLCDDVDRRRRSVHIRVRVSCSLLDKKTSSLMHFLVSGAFLAVEIVCF